MAGFRHLFRCIGEAICARGLKCLVELVPLGGALFDVAENAFQRLREQHREEHLLALIHAPQAEVNAEADAVAAIVAHDQPPEARQRLAGYLAQVPAALRRSLRSPSDPSGHTLPPSFRLGRPEDLLQLLPPRPPRFQPGDRPAGIGDWVLEELLGVGGFGEVWKAHHAHFDAIDPVAVKFCLDESARDRLLRHEAGILNQVMRQGRHPGIVALLDASLSSDPPCLKYEYVAGCDLSGIIRAWSELTPLDRAARATPLLRSLADIIAFAHRLNPPIVHRDLKPANILLSSSDSSRLRVTDFGIGGVASGVAMETALRGSHTPLYSSPEQMRGSSPDPRDDVYSLGVLWYQLLVGDVTAVPSGDWAAELEEQGRSGDVVRLLGACLSRGERRPRDAGELVARIDALSAKPIVIADDRLRRFLESGSAGPVSWLLDLTGKAIGDEGLEALAATPALANLDTLLLSSCHIGDRGLIALAGSPHTRNLQRLVLWDNRITDAGVRALAASPHLSALTALDLGRNRLGDEGVKSLAASPTLSRLSALILVSNQIGDEGALALAASPYLANLAELKPLDNRITAVGVTALKTAFGKRVRIM